MLGKQSMGTTRWTLTDTCKLINSIYESFYTVIVGQWVLGSVINTNLKDKAGNYFLYIFGDKQHMQQQFSNEMLVLRHWFP